MSNPTSESYLAKYKIWLIPMLGILLLGVIIYNNTGSATSGAKCPLTGQPIPQPAPNNVANVPPPAVVSEAAKPESPAGITLLPRVAIEAVLASNPFHSRLAFEKPPSESANLATMPPAGIEVTASVAPPSLATQPAVETSELREEAKPPVLNVTGVFRNGKRAAAIINDRIVHAGETVAEGWRLVSIDATGLVVEPFAR